MAFKIVCEWDEWYFVEVNGETVFATKDAQEASDFVEDYGEDEEAFEEYMETEVYANELKCNENGEHVF